jgi:predicted choloylglycine hydrolase
MADSTEVFFEAISEPEPGDKWRALFDRLWPAYRRWFLKEGDAARPKYLTCERALRTYMPELLPTYQRLLALAGEGDLAARFLSLYRPTPYMTGCSQAVWTRDQPLLVRNYDYSPKLWESVLLHTAWNGRQVIAMSDCLWGALDGISETGLAVSLAFGGRRIVGDGFGIPLILRYILEFCDDASQATEVLCRVPSHMSYNVTLLDGAGKYATVFVAPDREPIVSRRPLATNHQESVEWTAHERATASLDRAHFLSLRLHDDGETRDRFVSRFLEPPLYQTNHHHGWGTLYTAVYDPTAKRSTYRWPGYCLEQDLASANEQTLALRFT